MVGALLVALVSLAVLQYRWIARVSEAERDRLKATLDSAATRVAGEVDRELVRVHQAFPSPDDLPEAELEAALAARLARWRTSAPSPNLVRELLVVTRRGPDDVSLRRLDEKSGRLVPASFDGGLESVQRLFDARAKLPLVDERLPGLILPIRSAAPSPARDPGGPGAGRPQPEDRPAEDGTRRPPPPGRTRPDGPPRPRRTEEPDGGAARRPPRDHVVVRLDLGTLRDELLPRLAQREFAGPEGVAFTLTVTLAADPAVLVFLDGPALGTGKGGEADAVKRFFTLTRPGDGPEPGKWVLSVYHPSGSLEEAVSGARRWNLAVSLAILLVLGSAGALLVVSTRRAQRLARQQMDFVAGISHELRTPLTAMRSAGQNLADGIVESPEKVRTYGALIEREGRRLTEMVGRVLTFAGMQSGSQTFQSQPVDVRALVEGVLADGRWVLEERHVTVESRIADGLPGVLGDATALKQALANLVDNALKYGGSARWIGVEARTVATSRGEEVVLSVSDHGIGIRHGELSRLFEPFFRSGDEAAAGITGSGLGLAVVRGIVEAHGGRVTAESTPGEGSTFTIHLPAIPAGVPPGAGA